VSQDTWDANVNRRMTVAQLLAWCEQVSHGKLDGITISGGEPFDQPKALSALLDGLHDWRERLNTDLDILCYSGYPLTRLKNKHANIINKLDALIPEPYIDHQPTTQIWRGSDNQSLQLLTERAQRKYATFLTADIPPANKQIQVMLDGKQVWVIGIPQRGDMNRLEASCEEQGVRFHQPSWRT